MEGCRCAQMPPGQWCPTCLPYARLAGLVVGVQARQGCTQTPRQGEETWQGVGGNLDAHRGSERGGRLTQNEAYNLQHTAGHLPGVVPRDAPASTAKKGENLQGIRYRSKVEARFAQEIAQVWQHEGRIRAWWFESLTLTLAPQTRYTPDFLLDGWEGKVLLIETKGAFVREDSWQKLKIAAAKYPLFAFELWQWNRGVWTHKQIPAY